MRIVQLYSRLLVTITITFTLILSCDRHVYFNGIIQPHGNVFTQDGLAPDYKIDSLKPRFIQYYTLGGLASDYRDKFLLPGQIDNIIEKHPEWEFVYYVECKDSGELGYLINLLKKYDEKWRAIVFFNQEFRKVYGFEDENSFSAQGFFFSHDNTPLGSPMRDRSGRYINHYIERFNKQYGY